MGILVTGPIFLSFFFAIQNMAQHILSLNDGGILWFTDLSTPDNTYCFPVLTALTFYFNLMVSKSLFVTFEFQVTINFHEQ